MVFDYDKFLDDKIEEYNEQFADYDPSELDEIEGKPEPDIKKGQIVKVRDHENGKWLTDVYEDYSDGDIYPYKCENDSWTYCRLPTKKEIIELLKGRE